MAKIPKFKITEEQIEKLADCCDCIHLFDNYQQNLIRDTAERFVKFGETTVLSEKQSEVLRLLHLKSRIAKALKSATEKQTEGA